MKKDERIDPMDPVLEGFGPYYEEDTEKARPQEILYTEGLKPWTRHEPLLIKTYTDE